MQENLDIEIQDVQPEEQSALQLPLNFLTFGEIENDDVKVYIRQDTYKALEKLAASDTSRELGSILIGDYTQQMGKIHVVISDFIEARYTDASASTLTFTHETWDYIHQEHEKRFADKKIIGWQHTHPNYGIFLSNYDMFIQDNFFNMPFQVAYVIDPVQNIRGFFQWKNDKVEKLKGYYIYDELGKPIKIEQTRHKPADKQAAPKSGASPALLVMLIAVICLLAGAMLFIHQRDNTLMARQNAALEEQAAVISQLQQQLEESQDAAEQLQDQIDANETTIRQQNTVISQLQQQLAESAVSMEELTALVNAQQQQIDQLQQDALGAVRFIYCTVSYGDTLTGLCQANGVDYYANLSIILAVNGITNPDQIYAGQTILLPVFGE